MSAFPRSRIGPRPDVPMTALAMRRCRERGIDLDAVRRIVTEGHPVVIKTRFVHLALDEPGLRKVRVVILEGMVVSAYKLRRLPGRERDRIRRERWQQQQAPPVLRAVAPPEPEPRPLDESLAGIEWDMRRRPTVGALVVLSCAAGLAGLVVLLAWAIFG